MGWVSDLAAAIEKGLRTVEEGRPYLVDVTVLPRSPRGKYRERGLAAFGGPG